MNKLVELYRYGNFGGQNYSGGRTLRPDEPLTKKDLQTPPTSKLDYAYKKHDIKYAIAGFDETQKQREERLRQADRELVEDLQELRNKNPLSTKDKINVGLAELAFKSKLKFDAPYKNIPKIKGDYNLVNDYNKALFGEHKQDTHKLKQINKTIYNKYNLQEIDTKRKRRLKNNLQ